MKSFLERNKIYFEIVSSMMFGGAALFISLASFNTSKEQLAISEITTKPHFYVETVLYKDPKSKMYNDSEMRIYNVGAAVYNISVNSREFIEVNFFGEHSRKVILPISGYYFAQFDNYTPTGLLTTLKGPNNNLVMSKLDFDSLEYSKKNTIKYFEFQLKILVSISYTNRKNTKTTEYFLDKKQVPYSQISSYIKKYNKTPLLELHSATVESILLAANNSLTRPSN